MEIKCTVTVRVPYGAASAICRRWNISHFLFVLNQQRQPYENNHKFEQSATLKTTMSSTTDPLLGNIHLIPHSCIAKHLPSISTDGFPGIPMFATRGIQQLRTLLLICAVLPWLLMWSACVCAHAVGVSWLKLAVVLAVAPVNPVLIVIYMVLLFLSLVMLIMLACVAVLTCMCCCVDLHVLLCCVWLICCCAAKPTST